MRLIFFLALYLFIVVIKTASVPSSEIKGSLITLRRLKQKYKKERGKINYHLTELHNMRMIEKIRNRKKARIKITSLGEVFTS